MVSHASNIHGDNSLLKSEPYQGAGDGFDLNSVTSPLIMDRLQEAQTAAPSQFTNQVGAPTPNFLSMGG